MIAILLGKAILCLENLETKWAFTKHLSAGQDFISFLGLGAIWNFCRKKISHHPTLSVKEWHDKENQDSPHHAPPKEEYWLFFMLFHHWTNWRSALHGLTLHPGWESDAVTKAEWGRAHIVASPTGTLNFQYYHIWKRARYHHEHHEWWLCNS